MIGNVYRIEHDGFVGEVIGTYVTKEGKEGVVLQQVGSRVVHVYGRKWLMEPISPMSLWGDHAWRLFGYSIATQNNQDEIAKALGEISAILADHGDVKIDVRQKTEE